MTLVTTALTGNSYLSWSHSIKIVLCGKVKLGFISGKCEITREDSQDYEQWIRVNGMVTSWILNSISKDIIEAFIYTTFTWDLWQELEETCAASELTWLSTLLHDIGVYFKTPHVLFCNNLSSLDLTTNPVFHARTKHVEADNHFVLEKIANLALVTQFIPTRYQLADMFTKALSKTPFLTNRLNLGVLIITH